MWNMIKTEMMKTYIYIDVSNIRYACLWSSEFNLDFVKLYNYFKTKYPMLKDVRYYEGIARDDSKKEKHFKFLHDTIGYTICSLERKSYVEPPKYEFFECKECHTRNVVQVLNRSVKLKSNVDVYLASDMIGQVVSATEPIHVILVSCDGDYTEAIDTMLKLNESVYVTILATPFKKKNNYLSARLKKYADRRSKRVSLTNIESIRDYVSQPIKKSKKS